jgi:CheY-like chemotaxis protein
LTFAWADTSPPGQEHFVTENCTAEASIGAPPSRRILIIEDNDDGRESLRTLLEAWGHQVEVAADGREGLYKAMSGWAEVALIDIGLPGLNGYQVAEQVRAVLGQRILLVACTAYGRPEDRLRALAAGFDAHLVKPLDLEQLAHYLTEALP